MEIKSASMFVDGMLRNIACPTITVIHGINARNGNLAPSEIEPITAIDAIESVIEDNRQSGSEALRVTAKLEKLIYPSIFGE